MGFRFKTSWAFLFALSFVTSAAAQITVQVHNSSAASASVVRQAELEAANILADAGIRVMWVNCSNSSPVSEECLGDDDPNEFVLHIVSDGRTSTDSVFGEAFLGDDGIGKYCDIFFSRIQDEQRASGINPARLLGAVAAHELGHLLLGFHAHSQGGIMERTWRQESLRAISMGTFRFTRDQAAAMQTRVAAKQLRVAKTDASSALVKSEISGPLLLRLRFQQ